MSWLPLYLRGALGMWRATQTVNEAMKLGLRHSRWPIWRGQDGGRKKSPLRIHGNRPNMARIIFIRRRFDPRLIRRNPHPMWRKAAMDTRRWPAARSRIWTPISAAVGAGRTQPLPSFKAIFRPRSLMRPKTIGLLLRRRPLLFASAQAFHNGGLGKGGS